MNRLQPIILTGALFVFASGCNKPAPSVDPQMRADYERRAAEYDAQTKRIAEHTIEQIRRTEEQYNKTDELLEVNARQAKMSDEQQVRMEKLLQKWEEQAIRQDAILDQQEKLYQRLSGDSEKK